MCSGEGADEEAEDGDRAKRKKKEPLITLAEDDDGKPVLPDPDGDGGMRAEALAQALRQFIMSHYRKCPWIYSPAVLTSVSMTRDRM